MAIAGHWAHRQALEFAASIEVLLWCAGGSEPQLSSLDLLERLLSRADAAYEISERTLARLQPGADAPGLLSVVRLPRWQPRELLNGPAGLVLVCDGIEYAGNLGSLLRTVDASGADGLIVTNPVARLTHPAIFSASRGTVLTTPNLELLTVDRARDELAGAGFQLVVADPDAAVDFRSLGYGARRTAVVVGAEGAGVSRAWRDAATHCVSIPMRGRADSLNVATAAGVLLFEATHPREPEPAGSRGKE